jgi:hypothetical protein
MQAMVLNKIGAALERTEAPADGIADYGLANKLELKTRWKWRPVNRNTILWHYYLTRENSHCFYGDNFPKKCQTWVSWVNAP